MIKIYQSIGYLNRTIEFIVKENKENVTVSAELTGGHRFPFVQYGTFATRDKVLQNRLEASKFFNKDFRLLKAGDEVQPKTDTRTLRERYDMLLKEHSELERKYNDLLNGNEEVKEVEKDLVRKHISIPGIVNGQQAKEYLLKEFEDLKANSMPNSKAIRNRAEERDIVFPDWSEK